MIKEHILKPYNYFVALFEQTGITAPVLVKIIHNDFKVTPELSPFYRDAGLFEITISNFDDLGILPSDNVSIESEIIYTGSADFRTESFLNTEHDVIFVNGYLIPFSSRENVNGRFIIKYTKINN